MSKKNLNPSIVNALDTNYVTLLTDAEKKARVMIEEARKRKLMKIKKARDLAQSEVENCKLEFESKLQAFMKNEGSAKNKTSLMHEQQFNKKIIELKTAFAKNQESTIQFAIKKVMEIKIEPHKNLCNDGSF